MTNVVIPNRPLPSEERDINAILANFDAITKVINGELDHGNLAAAAGITKEQLATAVVEQLENKVALESKKSIIATEQSRENAAYGTLATPDEVTVVLPASGLIAVGYQALWKESVASAARAAIFVGANELKLGTAGTGAPNAAEAEASHGQGAIFKALASAWRGLGSEDKRGISTVEDSVVTTGQVLGGGWDPQATTGGVMGGPCYIFAAAGTYKVSVQFKATSGKVTVTNRKLWAWIVA